MTYSPHLSWALAKSAGLDDSAANSMRDIRLKTTRSGVPSIYTLRHLAAVTGAPYGLLRSVVMRVGSPYREIDIPKRSGGVRHLYTPVESLMDAQRWILHEVLDQLPRNPNSYAYFAGVTPAECASSHVGASWMIKADIHNYFPSIDERAVFRVFEGLGYSRLLSFELARLCTWPTSASRATNRAQSGTPYPISPIGVLPQGAPTSGALANASTFKLDDDLFDFASREGFVYTRYSDDITLSATSTFDRVRASSLIAQLRRIVTASGLRLHERKVQVVSPGSRKVVLGLLVLDDSIRITPERRRRIELYLHGVSKYGVIQFADRRGFESVLTFVNHVDGWLAYTSHIEPDWTKSRMQKWVAALESHGISREALGG